MSRRQLTFGSIPLGVRTPMVRKSHKRHQNQECEYKNRTKKIANNFQMYSEKLKNGSRYYVPITSSQKRKGGHLFDSDDDAEEPIEELKKLIPISQSNYLHDSLACIYKNADANEIRMLTMLEHKNIVSHIIQSEEEVPRIQMEYCMGGSVKEYLSICDRDGEPRKLNLETLVQLIEHVGDALDYMYSAYRMIHGNISEGCILIQTPQIAGLPLSFEMLDELKKLCHENLDNANVKRCTFKLTHFDKAELVSGSIFECSARHCDIASLAKIVTSNASINSGFLKVFEQRFSTNQGFTVRAVINLLRQWCMLGELFSK